MAGIKEGSKIKMKIRIRKRIKSKSKRMIRRTKPDRNPAEIGCEMGISHQRQWHGSGTHTIQALV
jgi:hypothetical protein